MVFSNIDELAALARGGAVMLSKLLANHNALGQLTNSRFKVCLFVMLWQFLSHKHHH